MVNTILSDPEIREFINTSYALKPTVLKVQELVWKFAIREILRGENLLFLGESGCGKTMMVRMLQEVLQRPYFYFNMGATQDPRSTLIGNTHFKKEEGTYVAESLFVKAIQTPNAIINLDELSRAHPDAHNILMTPLDKTQRYVRIDEHPDSPTIKVAPGVTFLATANVGSEYSATRTLDRALKDRFSIVIMVPLTKSEEIELLTESYPSVDPFYIDAIAEIAHETRLQIKSNSPKVDTIISTRMTTKIAELLHDGFSLEEAAQVCIYPFYSDAGGADSPRGFMTQLVQRFNRDPQTKNRENPYKNGDPNGGHKVPW